MLITNGYLYHKIAFNKIDIYGENLIIHYFVPHSSDQTLQKIKIFFVSKSREVKLF